nr:hypothetical protein [Tanacetum cinerariifolium]
MDNKKHIVNLKSFRDMLHICPRVHGQSFAEPPFEEEILAFIRFLGHSVSIKTLTDAYKEYYAIATGEAAPKPKASARRTRTKASKAKSLSALSEVAMSEAQQLKLVTKRSMQQTYTSQPSGSGADKGTGSKPGVLNVPTDESEVELSWNSTDDEGDDNEEKDDDGDEEDEGDDGEEGNGDDDQEVGRDDDKDDEEGGDDEQEYDDEEFAEETRDEESFDPISKGNSRKNLEVENSHVALTPVNPDGQKQSSSVSSQFVTSMLNPTLDVGMESIFETTSQLDVQTPTSVAPLPMTAPTMTPSTITTITTTSQASILPTTVPSNIIQNLPNFGSLFRFDDRLRSLEANFSEAMQTNQFAEASDRLHDEAQRENEEFLKTVDENMQKIIKVQVKEQVKVQVSKILPRIEQAMNEQLKAEVLTRSSHSSRTSYVVAADLSEMELKKILIEKLEGNKRQDDDADKDEEPSTGPDLGSKRRREGKEPESASAPMKTATRSAGRSIQGSKSRQASASESTLAEEPMQTTSQMKEPSHLEFDVDQLDWVNPEGQQYPHNMLKPPPLIPNNRGRRVIPFEHFINNDLEYLRGGASSRKYTTSIMKTKAADYENIKWIEDLVPRTLWIQEPIGYDKHALWGVSHWGRKRQQFYGFAVNWESARDVYSKRRIIAVTELKIVEWHSYKHLDWITARRDDDKLYKFKEGDFKRLHIQNIEDILLLLMRVEDFQLGVESYQKKLNLTKPDSYRFDLKRKEAYTAHSNPRGFIYQNKDKRNRLMRIDELHKFSDGTLNDVRTALDDRLKGIRMQYLPQSIQRKSDKDEAAAMIQAINKRLKTRRIMRSLERFVGGRSILTDLQVTPTKPGRMTKPYSSHRFIANYFNAGNLKMEVKKFPLYTFTNVLRAIFYNSSVDEDEVNSELTVFMEACQAAYEASKPKIQRNSVERDRYGAHNHLVAAYFSEHQQYDEATFGRLGISLLMKCTIAIRQMAYRVNPDALDEYLKMGATTARKSLQLFCKAIMELYGEEFLRKPTYTDMKKLCLTRGKAWISWDVRKH